MAHVLISKPLKRSLFVLCLWWRPEVSTTDLFTLKADPVHFLGVIVHPTRAHVDPDGDSLQTKTQPKPKYSVKQLLEPLPTVHANVSPLTVDYKSIIVYFILQAMARDEKNYYQDTPKQIKRKINEYKRCHPDQFEKFLSSLSPAEPMEKWTVALGETRARSSSSGSGPGLDLV